MSIHKVVEYVFFFLILAGSGYLVWQVMSPFVTALALSIVIVTICYPLHEKVSKIVYKQNKSLAAAATTFIVVTLIILPLIFISSVFIKELVSFYNSLSTGQEMSFDVYIKNIETLAQRYLPDFKIDITSELRQGAEWLVGNIGTIFASTVSTIFIVLISLIGSFYFFRDGQEFLKLVIKISPLPDKDDEIIISRLSRAVRSVATGVLFVALLQGILAALGFTIFGIEKAVLWGAVGAILSVIPGIGTTTIMIPGIIYLFATGATGDAFGLTIWTLVTIIVVDNMLAPYLMSRGNNLHPFIMLTSVLGGITAFGPIGFIIGPVIVTLFIVLLEVYNQYIRVGIKK